MAVLLLPWGCNFKNNWAGQAELLLLDFFFLLYFFVLIVISFDQEICCSGLSGFTCYFSAGHLWLICDTRLKRGHLTSLPHKSCVNTSLTLFASLFFLLGE